MKTRPDKRWISTLAAVLIIPLAAFSELPKPSTMYYGIIKDQYGYPYQNGAQIFFHSGTNLVASHTVTRIFSPAVNFRARVEVDNGTGPLYVPTAVREGDPLTVSIKVNGVLKPIMEPTTIPAGDSGKATELTFTTSTDLDNDGLPDDWENLIIAYSGGSLTNISQVQPEDDFDGDGVSNLAEYQTGTFPFLDFDFLSITDFRLVLGENRSRVTFLTVPGMTYELEKTDSLAVNDWKGIPFALTESDLANLQTVVGDGYFRDLYLSHVDHTATGNVIHLRIKVR